MTRRLLAGLAVVLLLGALSGPALADDFEAYADRVEAAYDLAAGNTALVETDAEAQALADGIDALLPGSEVVELEGNRVEVDDSLVTALTTELRTARTPAERQEAAGRLADHLGSLSASVGGATGGFADDPAALEELLSTAERQDESAVMDALRQVLAWIEDLFAGLNVESTPGGELVVRIVLWVIGIGLVALLAWLVARAVRARRGRRAVPDIVSADGEAIVPAAEGLPEDPLTYADRLAEEGRLRDAVRVLFGGAARELVRAGVVRQTKTLTNGELLRAVGRTNTSAHRPLRTLAADFEVAWYGHIDPERAGYEGARESYRAVLAAAMSVGGVGR